MLSLGLALCARTEAVVAASGLTALDPLVASGDTPTALLALGGVEDCSKSMPGKQKRHNNEQTMLKSILYTTFREELTLV